MNKYFVATGIRLFSVEAPSAVDSIWVLKQTINQRRHVRRHPDIGMSLVQALDEGRLNFVVLSEDRSRLLCGEYQGQPENPVSRRLAQSLSSVIPSGLNFTTV